MHEYAEWEKRLEPSFSFDLRVCTVRESTSSSPTRRFCFEVISPHGSKVYQALSEDESRLWIRAITSAIECCLNETETRKKANGLDLAMAEIMKVDGNQQCADCQAANPDWCSLNLGILICKDCSGAHRSLGSHISKGITSI
jgi:Arf-GAP/coiled-coil/ANK repeat/PH domain-containing protein